MNDFFWIHLNLRPNIWVIYSTYKYITGNIVNADVYTEI